MSLFDTFDLELWTQAIGDVERSMLEGNGGFVFDQDDDLDLCEPRLTDEETNRLEEGQARLGEMILRLDGFDEEDGETASADDEVALAVAASSVTFLVLMRYEFLRDQQPARQHVFRD